MIYSTVNGALFCHAYSVLPLIVRKEGLPGSIIPYTWMYVLSEGEVAGSSRQRIPSMLHYFSERFSKEGTHGTSLCSHCVHRFLYRFKPLYSDASCTIRCTRPL